MIAIGYISVLMDKQTCEHQILDELKEGDILFACEISTSIF